MSEPLVESVLSALKAEFPDLAAASVSAARHLLTDIREDIRKWSAQAATGHITPEELEWLAKSRLDVVRLETLRETGLSHVRLDALRRRLAIHIVQVLFPTG
ncbi:MAG: hypothetical protein COV99_01470 [Bacteroidetes bacterium CG12_big_fil_rev_8_21_14_0_65_60_17]|nr:MAG: hypothetical protein COV99_01470 [Bacteroidetes bacterium CG12_big_fil_rev_8_21_14_0_65_60_17]